MVLFEVDDDRLDADAVVRLWSCTGGGGGGGESVDPTTVTGGGASSSLADDGILHSAHDCSEDLSVGTESKQHPCRLIGECTTPNLACARVCPAPLRNTFVTVGVDRRNDVTMPGTATQEPSDSWHVDLWLLKKPLSPSEEEVFLDKTLSFEGRADTDLDRAAAVGRSTESLQLYGNVCATELALTSSSSSTAQSGTESSPCLLLCSLTDAGYVLTHVSIFC